MLVLVEEEVSLPLLPLEIVVYFFSVLLLQVLEKVSLQVLLPLEIVVYF
ncbi:MAG: hypothetical protein H6925_01265 [Holosporaceae bacterium]|nr:MAG: hypothetical protein H6925_01265 [Holosporaceae bacterium]